MSTVSKTRYAAELQFENVEYFRGDNLLFKNLSFRLSAGQILWIQGDNGVGKTSILRLASGFTAPSSGTITTLEHGLASTPNQSVAFQGHSNALEPSFSVIEEIEFWLDIFDSQIKPQRCLEMIELDHRKTVKTKLLSAGQKRRLALARLIASERPIWLMDEPKAAMDKAGQALVDGLMKNHISSGGAILAATHSKTMKLGKNARRLLLENVS